MSEEFKNYLDSHLVIGGCGLGTKPNEEEKVEDKSEELPPPPQEVNIELPTEDEDKSKEEPKESAKEEQPKVKENPNGTFHGIFLAPMNHLQRITDVLTEMAKTDKELADAIALGKKTFEGCDRFIRNNMKDLAREMGKQEIVFDDNSVHAIARWYMVNPDACDVQNAVKEVKASKPKAEKKPKEKKKAEPKPKTNVVPLTPQIGAIKEKEEEGCKTKEGNKVEKDGQISLF